MRFKFISAFAILLLASAVARGQTKISGTNQCAKHDPQPAIEVADRPNHSFTLGQTKCAWTTPWEIAGVAGKQGVASFSGEIVGNRMRFHAYYVDEMANGDKAFYAYRGTATMKDGITQSEEGTWTLVRGTGKLKGVMGKGSYKGKPSADGGMTYDVEGEYQPVK